MDFSKNNPYDLLALIELGMFNFNDNQPLYKTEVLHGLKEQFKNQITDSEIIAVISAPRSASTYLCNALVRLTGYNYATLCYSYFRNENDLYLPHLYSFRQGVVSQLHTKATYSNVMLMNIFNVKAIITTRNIFDMIASHFHRYKNNPEIARNIKEGFSFIWLDEEYEKLSEEKQLDMLIDYMVPWYVNFYVSWKRFYKDGVVNAKWVKYEDIINDRVRVIKDIADYFRLKNTSGKTMEELVDFKSNVASMHKANSGEGEKLLSDEQKARVRRLFSYYPEVDFAEFGV